MPTIVDFDFENADQCERLFEILATYATEDGGGNKQIPDDVKAALPGRLNAFPGRHVFAAMLDGEMVGVAVCFELFSTFSARPILNIHDLAVLPSHRGHGIGSALIAAAENRANEIGCCKLSLEVYENNDGARRLYQRSGFGPKPPETLTLSMTKPLG